MSTCSVGPYFTPPNVVWAQEYPAYSVPWDWVRCVEKRAMTSEQVFSTSHSRERFWTEMRRPIRIAWGIRALQCKASRNQRLWLTPKKKTTDWQTADWRLGAGKVGKYQVDGGWMFLGLECSLWLYTATRNPEHFAHDIFGDIGLPWTICDYPYGIIWARPKFLRSLSLLK